MIFSPVNLVDFIFIQIYLLIIIISSKLFIYAKDNEKKTKYYLKLYWYNFLLVVLIKMIVYKSIEGDSKKL